MLTTIKKAISRSMPMGIRNCIWFLTDSEYRREYCANRKRISTLREAQNEVGRILLSKYDSNVMSGPFAGLSYLDQLGGTIPTHKILGTYEKELWPVVEEIIQRDYRTIIDIGAAEGYYVIGLARRLSEVRIVAFEAQAEMHPRIEELANRNGVQDRIEIHGFCDTSTLKGVLAEAGRTLIICDVEGAEEHILNPHEIPALRSADILVEVHDHIVEGITDVLRDRFGESHRITDIPGECRELDDFPFRGVVDERLQLAAMNESRAERWHWLWMDTAK